MLANVLPMTARSIGPSSNPGNSILIDGVSKTFDTRGGAVKALDNVSLNLRGGEFVSVVGPSGCGKSTLLSIVAGLKRASTGKVTIGSTPVNGPYEKAGIVFQKDLLMEWRTALDNVLLQVELRGLRKKDYVDRALDLLAKVNLQDFANKYPRELSGGMRQRVSICRALIHDPPILLMDEPFGALDALTRDEISADLTKVCEETGKTVVFITHSIAEAVHLSDRVIVMSPRPGKVLDDIRIDLPRPRQIQVRDTPEFGAYAQRIRAKLMAQPTP
jgi:NitT/TauT family transport system ATP-binding protein